MKLTTLIIQNADVLRRLARDPAPATQAALASELGRDGSNLSKSISHLAKENLVDRDTSKRSPVPTLTDLGRQAVAALDRAEGGETADALPEGWTLLHSGQIEFDPNNARSRIDAERLEALAYSIAERGLQQNLVVRPPLEPNGHWRLIAGERRLRAIRMVQERGEWPKGRRILCKIEHGEDLDADVAALHENLQREDLHPLDEAAAYKRLADVHGLGTAEIAARVKRSQRHVQDRLRFTDLREDLKHRMRLPEDHEHHLTPTAVRQLLNAQRPKPPAPEARPPEPEQDDIPSFLRRLASCDAAPRSEAPTTPDPAVHRFSAGGNNVADVRKRIEADQAEKDALAALKLDPHVRLALFELAHKLQTQPASGFAEPQVITHQIWLDGCFSVLAKEGLARVLPTLTGQYAVLTFKGDRMLGLQRDGRDGPIGDLELHAVRSAAGHPNWPAGGGYVTAFLQDPPDEVQPAATDLPVYRIDPTLTQEEIDAAYAATNAASDQALPTPPDVPEVVAALQTALRILIDTADGVADFLEAHQETLADADGVTECLELRRAIAVAEDAMHQQGADDYTSLDAPADTPGSEPGRHTDELRPVADPAVPVRKSITPDHIVCLEDGRKFKCLKRHLRTRYNLSPDEYRARWGLPRDYPMVAPNYAKRRAELAQAMGVNL